METTAELVPAVDTKDVTSASEEQAHSLTMQPEAEEAVADGNGDAQQKDAHDEEPVEIAETVKEGDASEVAVVVDDMVAGVVAASEQEEVAEDEGAPTAIETDAVDESAVVAESVEAADPVTQDDDGHAHDEEPNVVESGASVDEVAVSASEVRTNVTSTEETATETTVVETTAVETTVTESTAIETTLTEATTIEEVKAEEVVIEKIMAEEAVTEEATSVSSATEEAVTQTATTEKVAVEKIATEEAVVEKAVVEEALAGDAVVEQSVTEEAATEEAVAEVAATVEIVSDTSPVTEPATETPATEEDVNVDALTEEAVAETAADTLAAEIEEVATETTTTEEIVAEKSVVEEAVTDAAVVELTTTEETSIKTKEIKATVTATETALVVTDDSLSREAAEVVANAIVEGIVAEAIAYVDEAVLTGSLASRAVDAQVIEEAALIAAAVATVDINSAEETRQEEIAASVEEQGGAPLEDTVAALADSVAIDETVSTTVAVQNETEELANATVEDNSAKLASSAAENEVDTTTEIDNAVGTIAVSETIEEKAEAVASESVAVESTTDDTAASVAAASVESVTIEMKSSDAPDQPTQPTELSTVPLNDEPKGSADVLSASHSASSDEEGWRSDDNNSVDGGDGSTKKKSRAFRSPVRSMISRFANKVSSSMPKKRLGAHRTESAAKLDLVSPSPVQGAVTRLESPQEEKPETHRTESAAKLDLDGNSPVKHIVHRFESPQHNSLDNLKIRTVRTFFDEKERSIHVNQEKEKYDSTLKPVAEGEATPKKASPTVVKTPKPSPKAAEDATQASELTPVSPAPAKKAAEDLKEANATIDTTTVTPVKNMVSRFEKKPEQSLDSLSFRTVRTFFPKIEEPSIRVGAEKQKYEALTEQQMTEVRRLEEEKLAKKKALESASTEAEATDAPVASEEEHVLHVRDIAHQLEARSSLTRDLAPASLSRSSSGTSERVDTTPVRITQSSLGAYETIDTTPTRLARSTSNGSDRSSVGGATLPPSLSHGTSASSDRPPRFVASSQSDASNHNGETPSGDEFRVKDVAQRFESRLTLSPQNATARVRRSSGAEVTLGVANSQLRRASEPPAKEPFVAPVVVINSEEKSEEEVFHVKDIAHRFKAKQESPVTGSLSRQSSGVETTAIPTHATAATPPRFHRNSSQGSTKSVPATPAPATPASDPTTPKQVQVTANAVIETTLSANVKDIAQRFETNRAQSIETPAYRTMETFFKEVEEPSIRVRAEKAKLEALEKQKELEAKLAWAKTLHAEEEAAAAVKKTETLHWFLMPAAANPAFVRLHTMLTDRDPVTALAMFPRQELPTAEDDSDLPVPLIPMDLPPFA